MIGYHPQVILAGRRINDGMGKYVAEQTVKHMIRHGVHVKGAHVNVLGPDLQGKLPRPAQLAVIDVIHELQSLRRRRARARPGRRRRRGAARIRRRADAAGTQLPRADAIVAAVAHNDFARRSLDELCAKVVPDGLYIDVKCQLDAGGAAARGDSHVWRL